MGRFALIRVAGLPGRLWLAAAAPELFGLLRQLDQAQVRYAELATELAEQIGDELVPHPALSVAQRRQVLGLRRRLHRGLPVTADDQEQLRATLRTLDHHPGSPLQAGSLPARLDRASAQLHEVQTLTARASEGYAAEQRRLQGLPWQLLNDDPVGRRAIASGVIVPAEDIRQRLARGEAWTTRRMRRREAYLWRMIARGTVKTTPRTWLTHVALAGVDESVTPLLRLPPLADRCAVDEVENVHAPRRQLALSGQLEPDTRLAISPLRQLTGDRARFWAVDPANPGELRSVTVRQIPQLSAIVDALDRGVLTLAELQTQLLGPNPGGPERELLSGFVGRLATVGVVEASTPPRRSRPQWETLTAPAAPAASAAPPGPPGDDQFLDVYRAATGTVPGAACQAVEQAAGQALRIAALILREFRREAPPFLARLDSEPRPVLDVLAERLDEVAAAGHTQPEDEAAGPPPAGHPGAGPTTGWHPPTPGSAYHRLVSWIDARAATSPGGPPLRLSAAVLDALEAPELDLAWPMDCLLRPGSSGQATVLDLLLPAGILDARFSQALADLHDSLPHVAAYREFLAELDERTGTASVELMIPPLRHLAANAVRRPAYTRMWTGDADRSAYGEPAPGEPVQFLPLSDLTVRRDGDSVVVAAAGRPVRILYHSTRVAPWPWNLLEELLTHGTGQRQWMMPRLRCPLVALPHRGFLPRLVIDDSLVLSPAQWRLSSELFWQSASATGWEKIRRLVRVREEWGLPRFVVVYSHRTGKPYPCDLASLAAIEVVEQALPVGADAPARDVYIEEMLPAPDDLPVLDLAHQSGDRSAAEVMLRLPGLTPPAELAARAAAIHPAAWPARTP